MKVIVRELGILKQAEFEVGDLTVICGGNNTGKTYATYALYGFLSFWHESVSYGFFNADDLSDLMKRGSLKITLDDIFGAVNGIIEDACDEFNRHIPMCFGTATKYYTNSEFRIQIDSIGFADIEKSLVSKTPNGKPLFEISKIREEMTINIKAVSSPDDIKVVGDEYLMYHINVCIQDILFSTFLPQPFIASIERTGAVMFQRELDINRNQLLEQVINRDKDLEPLDIFIRTYHDKRYALPVRRDVDFIRDLENVAKNVSTIAQENPDILTLFAVLAGGEYKATKEAVYYLPNKSKARLTMGESASSVRSLLNLGMYIQHIASPGDLLMIDEPELNLHPGNQRLMARLLARLVNLGIRVFITTHSDYILKELNALMMMNNIGDNAADIMEKYGYVKSELLDANKVRAYIAKKAVYKTVEHKNKQGHTFVKAIIGKQGIEVGDFDATIIAMNEIQDELFLESLS